MSHEATWRGRDDLTIDDRWRGTKLALDDERTPKAQHDQMNII